MLMFPKVWKQPKLAVAPLPQLEPLLEQVKVL